MYIAENLILDVQILVLVSEYTFSSPVMLAAILQDSGLATVIGREPRSLPSFFAGAPSFSLPYSHIQGEVSSHHLIRPNYSDNQNSLVDIVVPSGQDILERALLFLEPMQGGLHYKGQRLELSILDKTVNR